MEMTGLESFDSALQKTDICLNEIVQKQGWEDKHRACTVLRSVLHTLWDRLTVYKQIMHWKSSKLPYLQCW